MIEQKHPFIITNNGNAVVKDLYPYGWAIYFSEVFINILIRPILLINQNIQPYILSNCLVIIITKIL